MRSQLASDELEKSWDAWVDALSASYAKTVELMQAGKVADAAKEYKTGAAATVRKMYSEVASASPARFSKMSSDDWTDWARLLYVKMRKTEDALDGGKAEDAKKGLADLRQHFYDLHDKSQTLKSNDFIYLFNKKAGGENPAAEDLKKIQTDVDKAPLSNKAKAKPQEKEPNFATDKTDWTKAVDPILSDSKLSEGELEQLRKASEKFYRDFGIQFE